MKKVVIIISALLLAGCLNKIEFREIDEVKYLKENKNNISSVVFSRVTLGSHECYSLDIDEAYNLFMNVEYAKKSNISVTDDYITYIFTFNDESEKRFSFENKYFVYNKENYTLENFKHILTNEDNLIECEE